MPTNLKEKEGKIVCPECGETAHRIRRRPIDRFISLLKPVKRYYCDFCGWKDSVPKQAAEISSSCAQGK